MSNRSITSIISGDIINSRKTKKPQLWLKAVRAIFNKVGESPKVWEIFKGDYFQIEVKKKQDALLVALSIKAAVKSIEGLDVRLAIGIGKKTYNAARISESNGEAFINSGELFESLKKTTLAIKTPWEDIDEQVNLNLELALLTMNHWTQNSAEIVLHSINNPTLTQAQLGKKIGISQGRVSDRQKRAGFEEVMKMERRYRELILQK